MSSREERDNSRETKEARTTRRETYTISRAICLTRLEERREAGEGRGGAGERKVITEARREARRTERSEKYINSRTSSPLTLSGLL